MNNILKMLQLICKLPIANCKLLFAICLLPSVFLSCKEEVVDYQTNDCKAQAPFIKKLGYDPSRSVLSTSEARKMGLFLIQYNSNGDTSNGGRKLYQHPSWKSAGWLGPIQLDPQGNTFVGPVPVINLIDNPPALQNNIYKVDAHSGEMKLFTALPLISKDSINNPYGILGFAYLCETNTLYVSTVQGSTRSKENGCVYALDATTGEIIDKLENLDALGMGISYMAGKRVLYVSSARNSEVMEITLNDKGKFAKKLQVALSINGLGPRGDDKVRRIKFDKTTGTMKLHAIEFNYNLTAPTEKQESIYTYNWNDVDKKWTLVL
jgi:outer membrane protein assembly factor BamB